MTKNRNATSSENADINRRTVIKVTGTGLGTSLIAGCLDGGSGGSDGSDGSGGETGGGSGGDGQLEEFGLSSPPIGVPYGALSPHIEEDNLIAETIEPRGYQLDWQQTFDGPTLFASGNVDVSAMSYFEGARLSREQDQDIVSFGKVFASNQALFVKTGGPYDPETTGSPQASLDQIVEDGANLAIDSFASGNVPYHQRILDDVYGYTLSDEGSDFNVITTDFATMPQLLEDEEIAAAAYSPTSGGAVPIANNDVKGLFWVPNTYEREGWGLPPLNNLTTRLGFAEDNPNALLGVLDLFDEALGWLGSNLDSLIGDSDVVEEVGAENQEGADFMLRTLVGGESPLERPIVYEEASIDDSYVEQGTTLLENAEANNQVPSGWNDSFQFMTRSELEDLA